MSATEILEELPRLSSEERLKIYQHIAQLEHLDEIEPSPELHAAIEEGLRSMETEPMVPLAEVRSKIAQWAGLSS
jgi:hypothetical protein